MIASHPDALVNVAKWLLESMEGNKLVALQGDMGAGKTTFIKTLCKYMEVEDEVNSPTFSLVNEYYSSKYGSIYHFDFYRLKDEEEALDMGLDDYLYSGCYCFMEWPEKIRNLIPDECQRLEIDVKDGVRIFKLNHPQP